VQKGIQIVDVVLALLMFRGIATIEKFLRLISMMVGDDTDWEFKHTWLCHNFAAMCMVATPKGTESCLCCLIVLTTNNSMNCLGPGSQMTARIQRLRHGYSLLGQK
jgi:hypothetical protein